ncbi:MAG: helix-turn-helix transcriptional regulator [Clostridia bacterium]|nr:helix-turn-helix transcriptional regulator [Clostridia bacterium]
MALTFSDLYGVLTTNLERREVIVVKRKVTRETEILRNARLKKRLSQQQVAVIAGVHVRQYQRLEYGERSIGSVNMRFGLAICAILELDPFDLVQWFSEGWQLVSLEDP